MGNLISQRINSSSSSGLGFYFSYEYLHLTRYFNSIFVRKHQSLQPAAAGGLKIILHETFSISKSYSDHIVFPETLIALEILYTAPGELWNWTHPNPPSAAATAARDHHFPSSIHHHHTSISSSIMNPPPPAADHPEDITRSEEYTCVVSTKHGYPKMMTHLYGDVVVDSHPIPTSMPALSAATTPTALINHDNHHRRRRVYHGESSNNSNNYGYVSDDDDEAIKHCYICGKSYKQLGGISMLHMDEDFCNKKERDIKGKKRQYSR